MLDEGAYLCSEATIYRLLRERGQSGERRARATHPAKKKPGLMAEGPDQVWSWDITKLKGPARCSVCEAANQAGRECSACGAVMTRRSAAATAVRGRVAPVPMLPAPHGPLPPPVKQAVNREPSPRGNGPTTTSSASR